MSRYEKDPRDFGARGDGIADDTEALQAAINAAATDSGEVYIGPGTYKTSTLRIPPEVSIRANPTWSYARPGRTVLIPAREDLFCLLDISNAIGSVISGLCLRGERKGTDMHGIGMTREGHTMKAEHSLRIEHTKVESFSGNGVHFEGAWAVCMTNSQCIGNDGYGVYLDGCDAFIVDNWFSANGKAGFGGDTWNSAVNFTSNRIEWNRECGLSLRGGMRYNVTGNYFDRNFGPAIVIKDADNFHKRLNKHHTVMPYAITVTGNTIVRSGRTAEPGSEEDCHILLSRAAGITVTGNTFNVWKDDGRNGRISPWYGIIIEKCAHCVISANALLPGAVKKLILDKGGHGEGVIISDNTGATVPEAAAGCQDPFTPVHFMSEGGAAWYRDELKGENND